MIKLHFVVNLVLLFTCLCITSCDTSTEECLDDTENIKNEKRDNKDLHKQWKDVLLFPDGGVYSGGVVNGVQEGEGREEAASGDRYDGEWEGGIKSGAGKYKWKDGRSYKGNFCT